MQLNTTLTNAHSIRNRYLPLCLLLALAIGAWLRLDQVLSQVLINDEWHPVHQLTYYSRRHILLSFGNADYSIPLVMYYWHLMQWFGISELTLRLPMLVAGLLTVIAFPLALRDRFNSRVVALFAALLAFAPFLISYSRVARPYALTLLGIYVAYACIEKAIIGRHIRWRFALAYALLCGLIVWAHAITGPILVAPLIALWWAAWRGQGLAWLPLLRLTVLVGILMAVAVLPPLLGDPDALAGKSGVDSITFSTVYGALYLWVGTGSLAVLLVSLLFAGIGAPTVFRTLPVARWMALGIALTVLALIISRPWWVDRPLAFGRYLLPAVPLLLLTISVGIVRIADGISHLISDGKMRQTWTAVIAATYMLGHWITSPTPEILNLPNSYAQDSYFQYDYRKELNPIRIGFPTLPASPFWASLAKSPTASLTIAVAPFRYATYEWPAPLWERDSHQRVVPAYLWGACETTRHGEVPPDVRFNFRNAVHVKDKEIVMASGIDYLAYYLTQPHEGQSAPLPHCEAWIRKHYGVPDYEDAALLVWRINTALPQLSTTNVKP